MNKINKKIYKNKELILYFLLILVSYNIILNFFQNLGYLQVNSKLLEVLDTILFLLTIELVMILKQFYLL